MYYVFFLINSMNTGLIYTVHFKKHLDKIKTFLSDSQPG